MPDAARGEIFVAADEEALPFGDAELKPLRAGETLTWRLAA